MDELILHALTKKQLDNFIASPTHALLLAGPAGIGKTAIAEALATTLVGQSISTHPYFLLLKPENSSISIDSIRALQKFLLLKTIGDRQIRRVVLVEQAQTLTTEAQNAFLKLLEEPPADTLIIIAADRPKALLTTILSRVQTIVVHPPTEEQLSSVAYGKTPDSFSQAYRLSGGLPGLMHALLSQDQEHPLTKSVTLAKDILRMPAFERLALVDTLAKQKDVSLELTEALERIAQAGLAASSAKNDAASIRRWHKIRKISLKAMQAIEKSGNSKLVLDSLFLGIS